MVGSECDAKNITSPNTLFSKGDIIKYSLRELAGQKAFILI